MSQLLINEPRYTVVSMRFCEYLDLREVPIANDDDLYFQLSTNNIKNVYSFTDMDYRILPPYIYMLYSSRKEVGDVNPVATRILLDKFLLEPVPVSSNIDLLQTAPRGTVFFRRVDENQQPVNVTVDYIRRHWHYLFTHGMPYMRMSTRLYANTYFDFLRMYREIDTYMNDIMTKDMMMKKPIPVHCLRCMDIDNIYTTIMGAAIRRLYACLNFDDFNDINKIRNPSS
jgi:hypothetical protein